MNFIRDIKLNFVVNSVISIMLGLVLVIWPESVQEVIVYVIGVVVLMLGIGCLLAFIKLRAWTIGGVFDMFSGVVLLMLGVWMMSTPDDFSKTVLRMVGLFVLINGLMASGQTFSLRTATYARWWLSLMFSVVTIILGLVVTINPTFAGNLVFRVIGAILIYNGASNIWISTRVRKYVKNKESLKETIDVEAEIIDEDKKD